MCQQLLEVKKSIVANVSLAASEMADSGLETGSISPRENTSEISSTDLEITQATEYSANDDDSDRTSERTTERNKNKKMFLSDNEKCKTVSNYYEYHENSKTEPVSNKHNETYFSLETNQLTLENVERTNAEEEILQYENRMLNEPFYCESDCGSDENEPFEFSEPVPSTSSDHERRTCGTKVDRKISSNPEESGSIMKPKFDNSHSSVTIDRNSSSSSGYFIDASTLNDDVDIMSTNVIKSQYSSDNTPYFALSSYKEYKADKLSNITEEQSYKCSPLKSLTLQTGHEQVAEFERELKLNEYLQPFPESCKINRIHSTSEGKVDVNKSMDKESLAVEIKEADSGESAHPSPYPDNNSRITNIRDEKIKTSNDSKANARNENKKDTNDDKQGTLIRRNTFELDSNDEKLSVLRQEYERRQGSLVFQSAIPQYSGHRVDGDSSCHAKSFSDSLVPPAVTESSIIFSPNVQLPVNTQKPVSYLLNGYEINQTRKQNNFLPNNFRSYTIYPVTKSASDKSILDYSTDSDDTSNHCSTSLPITLDSTLKKDDRAYWSVKRGKCDETTPIISGGVSMSDYSKKSSDSPTVRRKTESTPIVSGGSVIMNKLETNVKSSRISSSMTAWVVDMSDCNKEDSGSRNKSRNMSQSFSTSGCVKKSVQTSNTGKQSNSLEFFVNLKDISSDKLAKSDHSFGKKKSDNNSKPYYEFYVDISDKKNDAKIKSSEKQDKKSIKNDVSTEGEKKNIFSMFIDLNDTNGNDRENIRDAPNRQSSSTTLNKLIDSKISNSSKNNNNTEDSQASHEQKRNKTKPSVFMFIESDSPVVRRRTLSTSRPTFKRHSWNVEKMQSPSGSNACVAKELMFRREHRRAHSVSIDSRDALKQSQTKTSSSSHSLRDIAKAESLKHTNSKISNEGESNSNNIDTSLEDVFDIKDTPPNSHVEINNDVELRTSVNHCEYKEIISSQNNLEASETNKNELSDTSAWEKTCTESTEDTQTHKSKTFDISSGSGPSPDSENRDYELTDLLNNRVGERLQIVAGNKISETHKSLSETIKKIECELKDPEYENAERTYEFCSSKGAKSLTINNNLKDVHLDSDKTNSSSFVRLSDLDKTPIANHAPDILTMKDDRSTCRMSSIMETSWIESKLATTRNNQSLVKPVSRKFASVMSTSLPSKQKSPLEDLTGDCEGEGIISESDLSSMQSSMGRSGAGMYLNFGYLFYLTYSLYNSKYGLKCALAVLSISLLEDVLLKCYLLSVFKLFQPVVVTFRLGKHCFV